MTERLRLAPAKNRAPDETLLARWWNGLTQAERRELAPDRRRHLAGVVVRFVEDGEPFDADADGIDFYEYLVNHEVFLDDGRTFHICSAHPEARACLATGCIPASFRCPRADVTCPMRAILGCSPAQDARLRLASQGSPSGREDE